MKERLLTELPVNPDQIRAAQRTQPRAPVKPDARYIALMAKQFARRHNLEVSSV